MTYYPCGLHILSKSLTRLKPPRKGSSKGERRAWYFFIKHGIEAIQEYSFDDLFDIGPLRFDFYLPKLNVCIEYDGPQHFRPVKFAGDDCYSATEAFARTQHHDMMKDEYCKYHGIKLIRIEYIFLDQIEIYLADKLGLSNTVGERKLTTFRTSKKSKKIQ
jgi:hypothetical protein